MGYVTLNCEWTEGCDKTKACRVSRSTEDGEDYIATQIERIKKEYPLATDITVVEPPFNEGKPYAVDILIDYIMSRRPDLDRKRVTELDWLILDTDRKDYFSNGYVTNLADAKKIFDDEESNYRDWVYLREPGFVIFDVTQHTSHELFLAHWYQILTQILPTNKEFDTYTVRGDEEAESFLHAQCGFYLSSAYGVGHVTKSSNMKLTGQEKIVFKNFTFRDLDP